MYCTSYMYNHTKIILPEEYDPKIKIQKILAVH